MKKITIIKQSNPISIEDIELFEKQNNLNLPEQYKEFLIKYNVIDIQETLFKKNNREFWIDTFFPFDNNDYLSLQNIYQNLSEFLENKYFAIANDPGGWKYVISLQNEDYGKIFFCRLDEDIENSLTLIAENFEEFIDGLEKYENNTLKII